MSAIFTYSQLGPGLSYRLNPSDGTVRGSAELRVGRFHMDPPVAGDCLMFHQQLFSDQILLMDGLQHLTTVRVSVFWSLDSSAFEPF